MKNAQQMHSDELLTVHDVAEYLRVSVGTVRKMTKDGRINAIIINKQGVRRFRWSDIKKFIGE